jgi:hypothetical protein
MILTALEGCVSKTAGQKRKLHVRVRIPTLIASCNGNNIKGNGDAYRTTDVFTLDTTSIKHSSQFESYEIKHPHIV